MQARARTCGTAIEMLYASVSRDRSLARPLWPARPRRAVQGCTRDDVWCACVAARAGSHDGAPIARSAWRFSLSRGSPGPRLARVLPPCNVPCLGPAVDRQSRVSSAVLSIAVDCASVKGKCANPLRWAGTASRFQSSPGRCSFFPCFMQQLELTARW